MREIENVRMKTAKANLTRKVTVRFKPDEFNKLNASFKSTTKNKLSEYIRYVLLEKPVTVYTRSRSMDELIAELLRLRGELSAIGSNFNQLVKRLHTASHFAEIKSLANASEIQRDKFTEKIAEINQKIAQFNTIWLQE
jgi:ribonuclease HIII